MRYATAACGRRLRSRVEFAEQCIVVPEGPYQGEHWRSHFQPFTYHVLHLMDSAGFRKFRFTGCVQSGKTFLVVINVLWHLFERNETVIYGVPDIHETGADKWREELLPVIDASPQMRQFLPRQGRGSKGGIPTAIKFTNGATLRFMGAGGGDHRRSHYTAPVVVKTEVDRYDIATESSRESSPVEQMEARTEAFNERAFSYEECTVTTASGRIFTELERSTRTRLCVPCVGCGEYVFPTRENFVGHEDAPNVHEAKTLGAFQCCACKTLWSEEDRRCMVTVENILPLHGEQTARIHEGGGVIVEGEIPQTDRLGVAWNAFHNLFWSTGKIAADEWNALYAANRHEADKKRRQFAWAIPAEPDEFALNALTVAEMKERTCSHSLRQVPPNTRWLSAGVDCRQTELHFVVRSWTLEGETVQAYITDIGTFHVDSRNLGVRAGLLAALVGLRERLRAGYRDSDGKTYKPGWTLIDIGWQERIVWEFLVDCALKNIRGFMPILGRGQSQPKGKGSYVQPDKITKGKIDWIGEQCYIRVSEHYRDLFHAQGIAAPAYFVFANSDVWKSFLRDGYKTPKGQPGALFTFQAETKEERDVLNLYENQIRAEKVEQKVVQGRGVVEVWKNDSRRPNHLGDADYYACVAANILGVRVAVKSRRYVVEETVRREPLTMPDGRAFMEV